MPIDAIAPADEAPGVVIKTKICSTQPGIDSQASSMDCMTKNEMQNKLKVRRLLSSPQIHSPFIVSAFVTALRPFFFLSPPGFLRQLFRLNMWGRGGNAMSDEKVPRQWRWCTVGMANIRLVGGQDAEEDVKEEGRGGFSS